MTGSGLSVRVRLPELDGTGLRSPCRWNMITRWAYGTSRSAPETCGRKNAHGPT